MINTNHYKIWSQKWNLRVSSYYKNYHFSWLTSMFSISFSPDFGHMTSKFRENVVYKWRLAQVMNVRTANISLFILEKSRKERIKSWRKTFTSLVFTAGNVKKIHDLILDHRHEISTIFYQFMKLMNIHYPGRNILHNMYFNIVSKKCTQAKSHTVRLVKTPWLFF